jgi:hypothetical protein
MTFRELCDRLERNEHEHALHALERIRCRTLESRVARAEAPAEQERKLRADTARDVPEWKGPAPPRRLHGCAADAGGELGR